MLKSLHIQNFRVFKDLRVSKLGRVNLVVGRNNSGKSCLLEAVWIYGEGGHESVLRKLVEGRREDLGSVLSLQGTAGDSPLDQALRDPLRHLFHGRDFLTDGGHPIVISERAGLGDFHEGPFVMLNPYAFRQVRVSPTLRASSVDGASLRDRVRLEKPADLYFGPIAYVLNIDFKDEDGRTTGTDVPLITLPGWFERAAGQPRHQVRHIPASGWSDADIATQWAPISVRPSLRRIVRDALRLIDPAIEEIVMVPGRDELPPEPIAVYGDELQLPLRSLGEGIGRLFRIAMAMAVAKGGYVLIDEFENGLHWEVQPKAWELVFKLAAELDIQVFATTHSLDCVKAFAKADAALPDVSGMLHRLGRSVRKSDEGKVTVRSYEREALEMAVQAGLEVR
ncbi:MAG: AAA family ATPase [Alphaproteobacteria bacterium]|nr:AAA family ATPase [Alphaproteobacteria bacterium]MCB9795130.1 AAA family ATPase [Alphaproteobacteria bacterium]